MAKTIDLVTHLKNRILLATYLFRSLPMEYVQNTVPEGKERQRIRNTIVYLKRVQFLAQKKALHGADFLYLTKKGYEYVITALLKGDEKRKLYAFSPNPSLRKSISEHSFMNFMFLWHYIASHPEYMTKEVRIYDDSNVKSCKLPAFYGGKDVVVSPDILVFTPDVSSPVFQKALCVENDTGRETYRVIYQKLVEYAVLIEKGLASNKITDLTIYFIIPTKKRIQQMFYNQNGILQLFGAYNNSRQVKDVRTRTIIQAFSNPRARIFISTFNQNQLHDPYTFEQYHLSDQLTKQNPTWKIYLP